MRMHILAVGLVVALSGKAFSQTPTGWQAGIDRFEKRTAAAKAGLATLTCACAVTSRVMPSAWVS